MPAPRGIGRTLRDALYEVALARPQWQFIAFHERAEPGAFLAPDPLTLRDTTSGTGASIAQLGLPSNVTPQRVRCPGDRFEAWLHLGLAWSARRAGVNLMWYPAPPMSRYAPGPAVVTVHDLLPLRSSESPRRQDRARTQRQLARIARQAVHIMTPSNATAQAMIETFGLTREVVSVVPWSADRGIVGALSATSNRADAARKGRERVGADCAYLLNFSGPAPRKNTTGLLDAFSRLPRAAREQTVLVLVGCAPQEFREGVLRKARRLQIQDRVRVIDFLAHEDLPAVLVGARALLMPSLGEGFGLPILDAFAAGIPVLTSRRDSLPEVAGPAAVYCEPSSPASIAGGIQQVLNPQVAERMVAAGHRQLTRFNWRASGARIADILSTAMVTRHPIGATRGVRNWSEVRPA